MSAYTLRLARPLEYEPTPEGPVRLRDPKRGEWVRTQPWTRDVLDALARGAPVADEPARVRRFLLSLEKVGYLHIDVPAPPAFGAYEVERELGRGGVGIAYLCRGPDGARVVAKRAWGFLHGDAAVRAALLHEADVLARLSHPGIVARVALLEHEGAPVLVREHVEGAPLLARFQDAPAAPAEARRVARAMADVLARVHAQGLVLVDHKPSNWFLLPDGAVKLLDAGHARPVGATRVGGTPGFLPPEQPAGPVSPASDVWGLGRVLAFLQSGRLPVLREGAVDDPLEGVPDAERALVASMCAADPAARPTMDEVRARLSGGA